MARKYLKGFSGLRIFPITTNTEESYIVGTMIKVPAAQSLSKEEQSESEDILADDSIWDTDSDVTGEEVTITLAELDNELRAKLRGGTYDEETKTYSFKRGDVAPELACSYRGLLANGTYRMWKHYRFKVSKVKMDLETKGNSKKSVEITGKFLDRACDGKFYDIKDTEDGNKDLVWLDTIESVPATEPVGQEDNEEELGGQS